MSKIAKVFRRDLKHVAGNAIALLVCVGLAVLPSLYAWFNIAGGWDPYGNTGALKVALANTDDGYEGGIIPFQVNVGQRVVASLSASDKIDYVVTDEDDAVDGVRSGEYYAAVVIPQNFTSDLLSVFTVNSTHPKLRYYVNEKRNAIASIVTGKASGSVQSMVDQGFSEAVTEAAASLFTDLSGVLDEDGLMTVATGLGDALEEAGNALQVGAQDIASYKGVVSSVRAVIEASLVGMSPNNLDLAGTLNNALGGARQFEAYAQDASNRVSSAVDAGLANAGAFEAAIDQAFDSAGGQRDRIAEALQKIGAAAQERRDSLQSFLDLLNALDGNVRDLTREVSIPGKYAELDIQYVHETQADISELKARVQTALNYLDNLLASYNRTLADLDTALANVEATRAQLKDLAARARDGINAARVTYNGEFSDAMSRLTSTISSAASEASRVSSGVRQMVNDAVPLLNDASNDLLKLEHTLDAASNDLSESADKLLDAHRGLADAVGTGSLDLVRTIVGSDPASLADFISAPVEVDRQPFYAIENNGSAMTPYYTTMALWVGGTLMGVLFYVGLSEEALRKTAAKPRHAYFGRLLFFLMVGACQSTILMLGDLFFLGVQCENPLLFLVTGWLASTVFINIIYSLATSFGDVGKAVAVLFMVIQVAGSGGTFPVEMLPAPFQVLYPFLPFVHSENAMRSAMFGMYGNDWFVEMGLLAAYLVPALLLGLLLRKPFVRVNEWIEERLEATKFM